MASNVNMEKLRTPRAAMGQLRDASAHLRRSDALHGSCSNHFPPTCCTCCGAAFSKRRAPRACARAARSACASRPSARAAAMAPRMMAHGRRTVRERRRRFQRCILTHCRPSPRAAEARPAAVCVRRLPPLAKVRAKARIAATRGARARADVPCVRALEQARSDGPLTGRRRHHLSTEPRHAAAHRRRRRSSSQQHPRSCRPRCPHPRRPRPALAAHPRRSHPRRHTLASLAALAAHALATHTLATLAAHTLDPHLAARTVCAAALLPPVLVVCTCAACAASPPTALH